MDRESARGGRDGYFALGFREPIGGFTDCLISSAANYTEVPVTEEDEIRRLMREEEFEDLMKAAPLPTEPLPCWYTTY